MMNVTSLVLKVEVMSEVYDKEKLDSALLTCNHLIANAIWSILEVELPKLLEGELREDFNVKLTTYTETANRQ